MDYRDTIQQIEELDRAAALRRQRGTERVVERVVRPGSTLWRMTEADREASRLHKTRMRHCDTHGDDAPHGFGLGCLLCLYEYDGKWRGPESMRPGISFDSARLRDPELAGFGQPMKP